MKIEDLSVVDPKGRVDVLAFNAAKVLMQQLEQQYGVVGVWEGLKPYINNAVVGGLKGIQLPAEAKVILGIIQANMNQKRIEEK